MPRPKQVAAFHVNTTCKPPNCCHISQWCNFSACALTGNRWGAFTRDASCVSITIVSKTFPIILIFTKNIISLWWCSHWLRNAIKIAQCMSLLVRQVVENHIYISPHPSTKAFYWSTFPLSKFVFRNLICGISWSVETQVLSGRKWCEKRLQNASA